LVGYCALMKKETNGPTTPSKKSTNPRPRLRNFHVRTHGPPRLGFIQSTRTGLAELPTIHAFSQIPLTSRAPDGLQASFTTNTRGFGGPGQTPPLGAPLSPPRSGKPTFNQDPLPPECRFFFDAANLRPPPQIALDSREFWVRPLAALGELRKECGDCFPIWAKQAPWTHVPVPVPMNPKNRSRKATLGIEGPPCWIR